MTTSPVDVLSTEEQDRTGVWAATSSDWEALNLLANCKEKIMLWTGKRETKLRQHNELVTYAEVISPDGQHSQEKSYSDLLLRLNY